MNPVFHHGQVIRVLVLYQVKVVIRVHLNQASHLIVVFLLYLLYLHGRVIVVIVLYHLIVRGQVLVNLLYQVIVVILHGHLTHLLVVVHQIQVILVVQIVVIHPVQIQVILVVLKAVTQVHPNHQYQAFHLNLVFHLCLVIVVILHLVLGHLIVLSVQYLQVLIAAIHLPVIQVVQNHHGQV